MLGNYANQSLTWKTVSTLNEYNEPTYSTTTIKGRKETANKLVRTDKGQEVISTACVFTESAIQNNDLIDNKLVISVEANVNLAGVIEFYEVYLI